MICSGDFKFLGMPLNTCTMHLTIEVYFYDILHCASQEELNWNKNLIERYIGREVNRFIIMILCVFFFTHLLMHV